MDLIHKDESYKIIGAAMEVHKELGSGFLEAIYHEALLIEFTEREIPYISEAKLDVSYKGRTLIKYYESDFICYDKIIVEIKAVNELSSIHESQVINYLKATGLKLGILINFGAASLEYRRLIRH